MSSQKKQTVAQQIFKTHWHVKVPYIQCFSEQYIKVVGMPTSGDPVRDREVMNEMVERYATIVEMIEVYNNGGDVIILNLPDAAKIYRLIYQHLMNWQTLMDKSLHKLDPPLDDLKLMDEFASTIYPIASRYLNQDLPVSGLAGKIAQMGKGVQDRRIMKPGGSQSAPPPTRTLISRPQRRTIGQPNNPDEGRQMTPAERAQQSGEMHSPVAASLKRLAIKRAGR